MLIIKISKAVTSKMTKITNNMNRWLKKGLEDGVAPILEQANICFFFG